MIQIPDYISIDRRRFIRNCIVVGVALTALAVVCFVLLIPGEFISSFVLPGDFDGIISFLGLFACMIFVMTFLPKIRTSYNENKFQFYMYLSSIISAVVLPGAATWSLYLPHPSAFFHGLIYLMIAISLSLFPFTIAMSLAPVETFINKNLLLGLNWKYATQQLPQYTGWPVSLACPELAALPPEAFEQRMLEFADLLSRNGIVHRHVVDQDTAVFYFYIDPNLKLITLSQGYMDLKYGLTHIVMTRHGDITLLVPEKDKSMFLKLQLKGPVMFNLLEMFRNATLNFLARQHKYAIQWLINKPCPTLNYQTTKGKFVLIMMPVLLLLMAALLFSMSKLASHKAYTPESIAAFILNNRHKDGSLGYGANCENCRFPLRDTAASILILERIEKLGLIDKNAAARYIASRQQDNGFFGKDSDKINIKETELAVDALRALDRLQAIDTRKLAQAITDSQSPDGLWKAPGHVPMSDNEYTYLHLKTMHCLDMLNAVNFEAARSAILYNKNKTEEPLAWYEIELGRMAGNHIPVTGALAQKNKEYYENVVRRKEWKTSSKSHYSDDLSRTAMLLARSDEEYNGMIFSMEGRLIRWNRPSNSVSAPQEITHVYPAFIALQDLLEFKKKNPPPKWYAPKFLMPLFLWIIGGLALCGWAVRDETRH